MSFSYFQFMKSAAFLIGILILSNGFSQKIIEYKLLPCKEPVGNTQFFNQGILSQKSENETFRIQIGLIDNCSFELQPSASIENDTLKINLENISKTTVFCGCYFKVDLVLSEVKDSFNVILVNNEPVTSIKSKYIDFPPNDPIHKKWVKNKSDSRGNKIGYWRIREKSGFYYISYFGDGSFFENTPLWTKYFSNKNELFSLRINLHANDGLTFSKKQYELILKEISEENTQ